MRHWHRCQRWKNKRLECPFRLSKEHKDDPDPPDPDDQLRFTRTARVRAGRPIVGGAAARQRVGVREPARVPERVASAVAGVPTPAVPVPLPDLIGLPFPQPAALEPIEDLIKDGIGQVPARWKPSEAQLEELADALAIPAPATKEAVVTAMAEEATVELIVGRAQNFLDVLPLAAIPLLRVLGGRFKGVAEALPKGAPRFKRLELTQASQQKQPNPKPVKPTPGQKELGKAANKPPAPKPAFRTTSKGFAGGAMSVNMSQQFIRTPSTRKFRQADPNL